MMYEEFPTDEDLLKCEYSDFCGLSEYNDCIHRKRCETLHIIKLSIELNEIIRKNELDKKDEKGEN